MFNRIKNTVHNIYAAVSSKLATVFSHRTVNKETLKELEKILIEADVGIKATRTIIATLTEKIATDNLTGQELKIFLQQHLYSLITQYTYSDNDVIY